MKNKLSKYLKALWQITKVFLVIILLSVVFSRFLIPNPVFEKPTSTVLLDKDNRLLGARIAGDGQWRLSQQACRMPYPAVRSEPQDSHSKSR